MQSYVCLNRNEFCYVWRAICARVRALLWRQFTEGQRKRFDLEAEDAVSLAIEQQRLQLGDLCEWQSWQ